MMNMKKNFIMIMFANIICLCINLITNFIIPKYVSIETYSMIKTYALYITYAGFFSLGYNDGMYLRYGGKKIKEISKEDIAVNFFNYIILIFLMAILVLFVGIALRNSVLIAFAFGMAVGNILGYLKSLYQATGEFKLYGKALNIEKITIFIANLILIFIIHADNYMYFIWCQIILGVLINLILLMKLEKNLKFITYCKFSMKAYIENIKSGFILMLGNFSSGFFTGIDRWFVKILLTTTHFALYSFAASMESFVNVFVSPITVTMYNYFCKEISAFQIRKTKKICLIWGFFLIASAYPAKWILENYLTEYMGANMIIFLLFAAQVFYIIVKGIYVNLYKAEKKQNKYLFQMIIMTCIAIVLNFILFKIFKNMESIAIATLVTSCIWMLLCEIECKNYRFSAMEYLYIVIGIALFLYTGYKINALLGIVVYFLGMSTLSLILMKSSMIDIKNYVVDFIKEKRMKKNECISKD